MGLLPYTATGLTPSVDEHLSCLVESGTDVIGWAAGRAYSRGSDLTETRCK